MPILPASAGFSQLAKSAASQRLASQFAALERQRAEPSEELGSQWPHYSSALGNHFRLDQYHPLEEIYDYLDGIARRHKHVKVFTIGQSAEGRPIKAVEVSNNRSDSDFVWLDALTHAREWITGSTVVYLLDQIVAGPRSSSGSDLIHSKNFIVVPVVNPDGYAFTWTSNRMWRKNRSKSRQRSPDSKCVGVSRSRQFTTLQLHFPLINHRPNRPI